MDPQHWQIVYSYGKTTGITPNVNDSEETDRTYNPKRTFQVFKLISKFSKSKIIHIILGLVFCVGKSVYDNLLRKTFRERQGHREHLQFSSPFIGGKNLGEMHRVLTPSPLSV